MLLTTLAHKRRHMKTSSLERKDPDVFLASRTPTCRSGICSIFPFLWIDVHEWQQLVISKHIYHRHWNTFSVVISNIFGKKRNIIVTFQSGQLTEQPKTLDNLGCFESKWLPVAIYLYCFYHGLSLYAFILLLATSRGKIFGIKCQPVVKTI
jgi:hypothetical protein